MKISWKFFRPLKQALPGKGDVDPLLVAIDRRVSALERTGQPRRHREREDESPEGSIADLLLLLPKLTTNSAGNVDFAGSQRSVLEQLYTVSVKSHAVVASGICIIGRLFANAGIDVEEGILHSTDVEHLGNLMADMGDLIGMLTALSSNCQRALLTD